MAFSQPLTVLLVAALTSGCAWPRSGEDSGAGEAEGAGAAVEEALAPLEESGEEVGALREAADEAYAAEDWDAAAAAYRRHLRLGSDDAGAWYRLGNSEARRGRLAAAQYAYHRSLHLDPERVEALHNLGLVQLQLGQRNLRAAARQRGEDEGPPEATTGYLECLTEILRGDPDAAECRSQDDLEETR